MTIRRCSLLLLALVVALPAAAQEARTIEFRPPPGSGVQTFAVRPPILRVRPGDTVVTETLYGGWYERAGGEWPGEVGPFHIEGAEPGDTLVVKIVRLRTNRDHAVSVHGFISAVASDMNTRMLNEPIPDRRYVWRLEKNGTVGVLDLPNSNRRMEVELAPMLGRVAVAPADGEAFGGLWPGNFGGNMDAADVREGATVYLPVFEKGALFYFGDGHALQGDGEICGSGLETTMDVTFEFGIIKGKRIAWPRIEDDTHIMVVGSIRPLGDALRIAAVELIEWLVADYGFDKWDAFQVVSQVMELRVANMVDPNHTVVAKFPKRYLGAPRPAD
jgi:amidase